jgi:hypothetical protein
MTRFRPGRASFSTSALLALALAGAAGAVTSDLPPLAALRAAEFETVLAKGKGIYLVLDPSEHRLTVKSRGLTLSEVELTEVALLEFRPLFAGGDDPQLAVPTVWKITEGPGDADRETIAPAVLRPYSDEEEEEPAPAADPAAPAKKKPEELERPSSYRVGLDNGWQLLITPDSPRAGFFRRFGAAVKDGWLRLQGKEPRHPPLVALVMPAETGQSLHHLFRTGNEILVLP